MPSTAATTPKPVVVTTTTKPFEIVGKPISLGEFARRMGTKVPKEWHILEESADGCIDLPIFRKAARGFHPPLSDDEADYAFCGMDENFDKKVCTFEFFGTLKIGHFFPSRSHLDHLKEVGALSERAQRGIPEIGSADVISTTPAPALPSIAANPKTVNEKYKTVPAILSGQAEFTLRVSSDSSGPTAQEEQELGEIFKSTVAQQLRMEVNIADIEGVHLNGVGNPNDKTVMILWTAGNVMHGGRLESELQSKADVIKRVIEQKAVEKGYAWLEHAQFWAKASLSYYGPKAATLPDGSKHSHEIGQKAGGQQE